MLIESGSTSFEYGKMDTAIFTHHLELRMVDERVIFPMFQYEPAIFYKNSGLQHKFRKCWNNIQIIWGICKNQVVLSPALPEVIRHIRPDDPDIIYPQFPGCPQEK